MLKIPVRNKYMKTGREIALTLYESSLEERESIIFEEIMQGNVPSFLRSFIKIKAIELSSDKKQHRIILWILPDYLSVGSDDDFLRIPMTPQTAQRIADKLDCLLPTKKIVDIIWNSGKVKLEPIPIDPKYYEITSPLIFYLHNELIEEQRRDKPGFPVVGHKKDVVITNRLLNNPNRVAIYGWHRRNGVPIQPLSIVHSSKYYDYSHGIRLVKNAVKVDDKAMRLEDLLVDKKLAPLLTYEGRMEFLRYQKNFKLN